MPSVRAYGDDAMWKDLVQFRRASVSMPSVRAYGDDARSLGLQPAQSATCFNALGAGVRR